jgi:hypothetical protein
MADVDEQPVGARLELRRVAKAWDVSPDIEKGLWCRILGEMAVSQDAVGDTEQAGVMSRR